MTNKKLEKKQREQILDNDRYQGSMIGGGANQEKPETKPAQPQPEDIGQAAVQPPRQYYQQQMQQKPAPYQSQWQNQMDQMVEQILNRGPFDYNVDEDALYKQYRESYLENGQRSMLDTLGQAQAMTGGYGNTYALGAGQQAYQGYMQELNDRIPELYQLALDRYQQAGQELYDRYGLLSGQEQKDYGRYQDRYSQWAQDRDFAYGQYVDDLYYQYQQGRDAVSDSQWQAAFDEDKRRYDQEWYMAHPELLGSSGGSGGAGGGSGGSGGGADGSDKGNTSMTEDEYIRYMLEKVAGNSYGYDDVSRTVADGIAMGEGTQWARDTINAAVDEGIITRAEGDVMWRQYQQNTPSLQGNQTYLNITPYYLR